tara:strand:+ start:276 stop:896 length:621 start_codon:yes stop_codon:yes gene_type:complete
VKIRLQFGILIVLLAFFGTLVEQPIVPNQQIVVHFSDQNISDLDTEKTILNIQEELQRIGAKHVQIGCDAQGQLKITYYSESDVELIQNLLLQENFKVSFNSNQDKSSNPSEQKVVKDYELNISEIQKDTHNDWGFEGTEVVEFNQKTDHPHNDFKVKAFAKYINTSHTIFENTTETEMYAVVIISNNNTHKIPEVRAGPNAARII